MLEQTREYLRGMFPPKKSSFPPSRVAEALSSDRGSNRGTELCHVHFAPEGRFALVEVRPSDTVADFRERVRVRSPHVSHVESRIILTGSSPLLAPTVDPLVVRMSEVRDDNSTPLTFMLGSSVPGGSSSSSSGLPS